MRASLSLLVVPAVFAASCQPRPSSAGADSAAGGGADSPVAKATPPSDSAPVTTAILVRTDKQQYKAGENVTLTVENHADATHTFNPCHRIVERQAGALWSVVAEPDRVCTMEAWLLEPHATRSGQTELPATLESGQYRIVVLMTPDRPSPSGQNQSVRAVSAPFTVER